MELKQGHYYHLYNRSNGQELIFRTSENYIYFLKNFRARFEVTLNTFAYCLMPTHFHFLVKINTSHISELKRQIGILLSAYSKAFNNSFERNGSLFQQHTKAKPIDDLTYLITLLTYIHQNPIRANLVSKLEDWPFSSYPDLAGLRNGSLVDKTLIETHFNSKIEFRKFSERTISKVKSKYWI